MPISRKYKLKDAFPMFSEEEEDSLDYRLVFKKEKKVYGFAKRGKQYRPSSNKMSYKPHYVKSGQKQFCIFKASYKRDKLLNKKHLDYIQKEGRGLGGTVPELYGADPENYEKRMTDLHWRFIISPESQKVDLTTLVEEFISRLEARTGYWLDWVATEHYNTDKKHAHVLINGFTLTTKHHPQKDRHIVKFDRLELKTFMRESLRDICTEMLGNRTHDEIMNTFTKQISSNSFNQLDKELIVLQSNDNKVKCSDLKKLPHCNFLHRRLQHLEDLRLAEYDENHIQYLMVKDWNEVLKLYGRYDTYLKCIGDLKCHPNNVKFHKLSTMGFISGKVMKKYFMQEDSFCHAVVLETTPGKYAYIPLDDAPVEMKLGNNIRLENNIIKTQAGYMKNRIKIIKLG